MPLGQGEISLIIYQLFSLIALNPNNMKFDLQAIVYVHMYICSSKTCIICYDK